MEDLQDLKRLEAWSAPPPSIAKNCKQLQGKYVNIQNWFKNVIFIRRINLGTLEG